MKRIMVSILLAGAMTSSPAQKFWKNNGEKEGRVVLTNSATNEKWTEKGKIKFETYDQPKETDICVFVDPDYKFQKIIGFGGAITDAAAETFYKLPKAKQNELIKAYYSLDGIGYNLVRTNMNSCDFSTDSYTYVKDNDASLRTFDVAHDEKFKIPMIKEAQKAIGKDDFTFYFSPWSPPAWMKTNNSMLKGGKLLPQYAQTWADYYVKFIQAYEKRGIPIWGLSIQNEPMAVQTWESCIYTAEDERDFLKNNLGPTLWKNGYKDKKVIIWDHNRDLLFQRATTTLGDPDAAKYASGIGFHWYETWSNNGKPLFNNVAETQQAFPNKFLIFSEGCKELFKFSGIYDVSLGELYARNMMHDLNNGTAAWTDWNVLLDETGGPNHLGNFCFAPIIADIRTGELHYTYEYYYIGHVSKFIRKGSQRVSTSSNRTDILATSFINTKGELVTVVMNESDKNCDVNLWIEGKSAKIAAPAHSIQTVII